ncbi:uncharacterized protein LOC101786969 [Setaria italica]|uniref:uncharacterized protein LOC101786969 n=1 Tax=Setaria italica TaxID=4555 RepID=UPI000350D289|nr:uncharacterized protein LOC101786969 [Setaria italica]
MDCKICSPRGIQLSPPPPSTSSPRPNPLEFLARACKPWISTPRPKIGATTARTPTSFEEKEHPVAAAAVRSAYARLAVEVEEAAAAAELGPVAAEEGAAAAEQRGAAELGPAAAEQRRRCICDKASVRTVVGDGAGGSGGRSGGRGGGRARRSRGRGGRSTADYIEPYDVENWVDVDDEDGAPQNVETIFPTSKEYEFDIDESSSSDDDLSTEIMGFMWMQQYHRKRTRDIAMAAVMIGTYYDTYMDKAPHRVPTVSGIEWVHETLCSRTACYNMFRMSSVLFYQLHDLLVENYGLRATRGMTTMEALGMFLWVIGAPQSLRQVEDRFVRSLETISRTFDNVLSSVLKLAVDIIKPKDPEFRTVHPRLRNPRFAPYFNNCIGAIDGTHIPVVVPNDKVVQHTGRHGYTSQNVLAICDFDMRFTFAVTGWPGSVHDMRVFSDALNKYGDKFPHPPAGKFYLVDSGYANRPGYLAPYKGTKYHLPEFRSGPMPKGMKETFNYAHSSLRNVIERSFGVLKMKWRILLGIPSFPMQKQSKIIVACMAIHNFIRENDMADRAFDMCDRDENFIPMPQVPNDEGDGINTQAGEEDCNMNAFRDELANALYNKS